MPNSLHKRQLLLLPGSRQGHDQDFIDRSCRWGCLVFLKAFSELSSAARKGRQEMQKSVFSHFGDCCSIVARARTVRMSLGATSEAQGARHSDRTEALGRGLSARRKPRRGKRVKVVRSVLLFRTGPDIPHAFVARRSGSASAPRRVRLPSTSGMEC